MMTRDGLAKLTDFGIARAVEERGLTEIGTVLGTAAFMAPEQAAGRPVGPPADVYGFGALLRHCAAGPLPAGLASVVEAATTADPAARPAAGEIHRRLLALTEGPSALESADGAAGAGAGAGGADADVAADADLAAAPTVVAPRPGVAPTELGCLSGTELIQPAFGLADPELLSIWVRLVVET